jgi:hypothetical protein
MTEAVAATMPLYESHKTVQALTIADVTGAKLTFVEAGHAAIEVPPEMFLRYTPVKGDFYIVYADGYRSFSPAKAFLEGYSPAAPATSSAAPAAPAAAAPAVDAEEAATEAEIQAKGLNAPRLKPEDIDAQIAAEAYYVFPRTMMTVCALTLKNGFVVTGESACASPANFDPDIGSKIARRNARQKIWALEGYLLRDSLYRQANPVPPATA